MSSNRAVGEEFCLVEQETEHLATAVSTHTQDAHFCRLTPFPTPLSALPTAPSPWPPPVAASTQPEQDPEGPPHHQEARNHPLWTLSSQLVYIFYQE